MSKPKPARYRTTNWSAYNAALRKRGSLLIWLDKEMAWHAPHEGHPGRPPVFSNAAIQFCLSIKVLFRLPLRQTAGMVAGLLRLAGLDWPVPDYSTLCRRQSEMGPWPQWGRVSPSNAEGDSPVLPDLLDQIPDDEDIGTVTADGAYDTRRCHGAIIARGGTAFGHSLEPVAFVPSLPIRKNGRPWKEDCPAARARNETLRATRHYGRAFWKRWTGYHARSRAEARMPSQVRSNLWR